MKVEPRKEHKWLQQLVGEWTSEADCSMGPGQPATTNYGTERVRMVGDLWMVGEGQGEMPGGGTATMIMTLGYDTKKEKYLGTWIGSMMTYMWHYDGEMDASGRILTLSAEGPSMAGDGTMAKYQDIIEIKNKDHRTLSSRVLGPDGTWNHFMTAHYRRKK